MTTLFRIDASIQGERSASSALADVVVDSFTGATPDATVRTRHLGQDPLPADAWQNAIGGSYTPEESRTPAQLEALALAAQLVQEVQDADVVVLASPLYNFGVSQHVKTWIDLINAAVPNGTLVLEGKPVVLVTTRGGAYGPGTPREGWDHNTAYLRQVLADVWGADLTVVEREFTLVGVNPALDQFADLAKQMHDTANTSAAAAGRSAAESVQGRKAA